MRGSKKAEKMQKHPEKKKEKKSEKKHINYKRERKKMILNGTSYKFIGVRRALKHDWA